MTFEENDTQIGYLEKEMEGLRLRVRSLDNEVAECEREGKLSEAHDALLLRLHVGRRLDDVSIEYIKALIRGIRIAREERARIMNDGESALDEQKEEAKGEMKA